MVLSGGEYGNLCLNGGPAVLATPTATPVVPVGPDHSHEAVMEQLAVRGINLARRPTNQGFVTSYERKCQGLTPQKFGGLLGPLANWWCARKSYGSMEIKNRGPVVMRCQAPENVPVLSTLALEFCCMHSLVLFRARRNMT
jgi:phospholipase C